MRIIRTLGAASLAAIMALSAGQAYADACSNAAETKKIIVMADWIPWANQGPMFAAQNKGYYENEGIEVEVISPANPADPIKLVARQRVHLSMTYVPEVMIAQDTGIPVKSMAVALRVLSSGLTVMPEQGVKTVADLKGKVLGVGPKADAQAFLNTILMKAGLTKKDVKIVDPGFGHINYLLSGKVVGAHSLKYAEHMIIEEIHAKEKKPDPIFFAYSDYGVPKMYYQLYVGNGDWAAANPGTMCRFLRATQKGADAYFTTNYHEEINKWIFSKNDIFSLPQHQGMMRGIKTHWKDASGAYWTQKESVWKEAQDWAVKEKLISVPPAASSYFTNDYVPGS